MILGLYRLGEYTNEVIRVMQVYLVRYITVDFLLFLYGTSKDILGGGLTHISNMFVR